MQTCFVVMGFGEKVDYQTQRKLNLDKTYGVINRAVTDAGLLCVRADNVVHSGVIDRPMYELLLGADLVIADLSTSNPNAIYELGVRHALRPNTTIVIAESQFKFPFDLHSLLIRPYTHLGPGIDYDEAERLRTELASAIKTLMAAPKVDSPVYTFLNALMPPGMRATTPPPAAVAAAKEAAADTTTEVLLGEIAKAKGKDDFVTAKALLANLLERQPGDAYVVQQLALCTYKAKLPDKKTALIDAREILRKLEPHTTADSETLGLWGAIHKRLWELEKDRAALDESIWAYERGFYLRQDYYTGINYAYVLNERAAVSPRADAIADYVTAQRVRRRVIRLCDGELARKISTDAGTPDDDARFWVLASLIEGHVGVGNEEKSREYEQQAQDLKRAAWMYDSLQTQLGSLRKLLEGQAPLVRF